ncbi:hypothetical protein KIL84_006753 [Mauremys mutica]|uniref:Uncharacterized protein n=1 Tax=Mauremys mutica TaxID=74926 RepID=A0A9D4AWF9_9SAUR|nr:hypothetical protein KIL84_006753 [Mauremys mutica]
MSYLHISTQYICYTTLQPSKSTVSVFPSSRQIKYFTGLQVHKKVDVFFLYRHLLNQNAGPFTGALPTVQQNTTTNITLIHILTAFWDPHDVNICACGEGKN